MKNKSLIFVFFYLALTAQNGIQKTFTFLDLPSSARIARLGGNAFAMLSNESADVLANPALLRDTLSGAITLHYDKFFGGIHYGIVSYAFSFPRWGNYAAHLQYLNYGKMREMDEYGNEKGDFSAYETALTFSWGRWFTSQFSLGSNVKYVYSSLYSKLAHGLAVDVAAMYTWQEHGWYGVLMLKNIGRQFKPYVKPVYEPFPFDAQLAVYKLLKGSPLALSFVYHHLHRWNILYFDSSRVEIDPITKEPQYPSKFQITFNTLLRHIHVGGDFYIGKHLSFGIGYNFQRRQELSYPSRRAFVGLTWGVTLSTRRFSISYARNSYYPGLSPNMFTFSTKLSAWK